MTIKAKRPAVRVQRRVRLYRVYVAQVNQTYVEVAAETPEDAREKGYAKWRKEESHSRVTWIEEAPNDQALAQPGRNQTTTP
jgi:hypothetical protein